MTQIFRKRARQSRITIDQDDTACERLFGPNVDPRLQMSMQMQMQMQMQMRMWVKMRMQMQM